MLLSNSMVETFEDTALYSNIEEEVIHPVSHNDSLTYQTKSEIIKRKKSIVALHGKTQEIIRNTKFNLPYYHPPKLSLNKLGNLELNMDIITPTIKKNLNKQEENEIPESVCGTPISAKIDDAFKIQHQFRYLNCFDQFNLSNLQESPELPLMTGHVVKHSETSLLNGPGMDHVPNFKRKLEYKHRALNLDVNAKDDLLSICDLLPHEGGLEDEALSIDLTDICKDIRANKYGQGDIDNTPQPTNESPIKRTQMTNTFESIGNGSQPNNNSSIRDIIKQTLERCKGNGTTKPLLMNINPNYVSSSHTINDIVIELEGVTTFAKPKANTAKFKSYKSRLTSFNSTNPVINSLERLKLDLAPKLRQKRLDGLRKRRQAYKAYKRMMKRDGAYQSDGQSSSSEEEISIPDVNIEENGTINASKKMNPQSELAQKTVMDANFSDKMMKNQVENDSKGYVNNKISKTEGSNLNKTDNTTNRFSTKSPSEQTSLLHCNELLGDEDLTDTSVFYPRNCSSYYNASEEFSKELFTGSSGSLNNSNNYNNTNNNNNNLLGISGSPYPFGDDVFNASFFKCDNPTALLLNGQIDAGDQPINWGSYFDSDLNSKRKLNSINGKNESAIENQGLEHEQNDQDLDIFGTEYKEIPLIRFDFNKSTTPDRVSDKTRYTNDKSHHQLPNLDEPDFRLPEFPKMNPKIFDLSTPLSHIQKNASFQIKDSNNSFSNTSLLGELLTPANSFVLNEKDSSFCLSEERSKNSKIIREDIEVNFVSNNVENPLDVGYNCSQTLSVTNNNGPLPNSEDLDQIKGFCSGTFATQAMSQNTGQTTPVKPKSVLKIIAPPKGSTPKRPAFDVDCLNEEANLPCLDDSAVENNNAEINLISNGHEVFAKYRNYHGQDNNYNSMNGIESDEISNLSQASYHIAPKNRNKTRIIESDEEDHVENLPTDSNSSFKPSDAIDITSSKHNSPLKPPATYDSSSQSYRDDSEDDDSQSYDSQGSKSPFKSKESTIAINEAKSYGLERVCENESESYKDEEDEFLDYLQQEPSVDKIVIGKKTKGKYRNEYIDEEAELSGSDAEHMDNADEEGDDDEYEVDAEAENLDIDQDELNEQLGKIHRKVTFDQDRREIKALQEVFFEDSEDADPNKLKRIRRFKWNFEDGGENDDFQTKNCKVNNGGEDGQSDVESDKDQITKHSMPNTNMPVFTSFHDYFQSQEILANGTENFGHSRKSMNSPTPRDKETEIIFDLRTGILKPQHELCLSPEDNFGETQPNLTTSNIGTKCAISRTLKFDTTLKSINSSESIELRHSMDIAENDAENFLIDENLDLPFLTRTTKTAQNNLFIARQQSSFTKSNASSIYKYLKNQEENSNSNHNNHNTSDNNTCSNSNFIFKRKTPPQKLSRNKKFGTKQTKLTPKLKVSFGGKRLEMKKSQKNMIKNSIFNYL